MRVTAGGFICKHEHGSNQRDSDECRYDKRYNKRVKFGWYRLGDAYADGVGTRCRPGDHERVELYWHNRDIV